MADPAIPPIIESYVATVSEMTGVTPTVTRVRYTRWLIELRTERVYATCWWRHDVTTGKVSFEGKGILQVDGKNRRVPKLRDLGDVIRYPDGKPAELPPMVKEFPRDRLPRILREKYDVLHASLAEHSAEATVEVRIGSGRARHDIDLAVDLDEHTGLRVPYRKVEGRWRMQKSRVLVIIDGIDRSHEVAGQGTGAAVDLLMKSRDRKPPPKTIGTPTDAEKVNSVAVRKSTVMRI